jgi:hypothetical protein
MKATNIYQTLKTKGYGTDGTKPQLPGVGSPLKKSPYKFNAGLKKAAAEGKLDNNPKFKDAVESSPAKLAPVVAAVGKKLLVGAAKKMIAKKAAEKLQQKQGSPAMMKDNPKKKKAIKSKKVGPEGVSYGKVTKTPNYDKPTGVKASPAKKYASDAQRKAVHASKAEKASPAKVKDVPSKGKKYSDKYKKGEVKHESITYDPVKKTTTRIFSDADVKKYGIKKKVVSKAKEKTPAKKASCGSPVKMDLGVAGPGNPKKAIRKAKRKATKGHKAGVRASNICKRSTRGKGSTYRN